MRHNNWVTTIGLIAILVIYMVAWAIWFGHLDSDCRRQGGVLAKGLSLSGYVCVAAPSPREP